jgi:hypothetical protein
VENAPLVAEQDALGSIYWSQFSSILPILGEKMAFYQKPM